MKFLLVALMPLLSAAFIVPHVPIGRAHVTTACRSSPPSLGLFDGLKKCVNEDNNAAPLRFLSRPETSILKLTRWRIFESHPLQNH